MRYLIIILLVYSHLVYSQSTLNPGDIAIVQYNADNQDQFSFVCLKNIDSGTLIYFTDNGWLSSGAFRATEGTFSWEADTIYNCGDVVSVDSISPIALSSSGDQLFAYQGSSSSPSFITAFNNEGAAVWQATATNANNSALPSSLSNGVNATAISEIDNVVYIDSTNLSLSNLKSIIFKDSVFAGSNTVNQYLSNTFSISGGCVLPVSWLSVSAIGKSDHIVISWETAQEHNSDRFELQYSVEGSSFQSLVTVKAAGNSSSIRSYQYLDFSNTSGYYRIKQIDYNGDIDYSETVSVKPFENAPYIINNLGQIQILAPNEITVYLYDSKFQMINTLSGIDELNYNTSFLPSGIYLLRIENMGKITNHKFALFK